MCGHAGRPAAFVGGLAAFYLALASPIEPFASLLLQVHMLQHLLLMMVAPPLLWLGWALLVYGPTYLYRVLAWRESDAFDWQKFPNHPLAASPNPHAFPEAPDPRAAELLAQLAGADDWGAFLAQNQTQAFIVVHDGRLVYE